MSRDEEISTLEAAGDQARTARERHEDAKRAERDLEGTALERAINGLRPALPAIVGDWYGRKAVRLDEVRRRGTSYVLFLAEDGLLWERVLTPVPGAPRPIGEKQGEWSWATEPTTPRAAMDRYDLTKCLKLLLRAMESTTTNRSTAIRKSLQRQVLLQRAVEILE